MLTGSSTGAANRPPWRLPIESAGSFVTCKERDQDRYGRMVALCSANVEDLNSWMVA